MSARTDLEIELAALKRQRLSYLNAARTTPDRKLAMKRLLVVERMSEEIESLELALVAMDDSTQPISLGLPATS